MQLRVNCTALRNVTGSKMNTAAEAGHSRMGQSDQRTFTFTFTWTVAVCASSTPQYGELAATRTGNERRSPVHVNVNVNLHVNVCHPFILLSRAISVFRDMPSAFAAIVLLPRQCCSVSMM